jgi:hypothetical protein
MKNLIFGYNQTTKSNRILLDIDNTLIVKQSKQRLKFKTVKQ